MCCFVHYYQYYRIFNIKCDVSIDYNLKLAAIQRINGSTWINGSTRINGSTVFFEWAELAVGSYISFVISFFSPILIPRGRGPQSFALQTTRIRRCKGGGKSHGRREAC